MLKNSQYLLMWTAGAVVGIGGVLLILAAVWLLWCAALPAFWPGAPEWLASPGYWPFVGIWILAGWVGRSVFGHSST